MNKRKTAIAAIFVAFVTAVIVSVCFFANNHHSGKMVVTTNFVAYDFARAVIGDASEVKILSRRRKISKRLLMQISLFILAGSLMSGSRKS